MIATNGPNMVRADALIKELMNFHWHTWHFFRTNVLEQLKEHAGDPQRLLKQPSKLPSMEK